MKQIVFIIVKHSIKCLLQTIRLKENNIQQKINDKQITSAKLTFFSFIEYWMIVTLLFFDILQNHIFLFVAFESTLCIDHQ